MTEKDFDVVVIGAGNGGLVSAATLANKGKKVLVLEKHNIPGGCGTSFRRGRFEFEVALHQLSGMGSAAEPGPTRQIFRELGIEDDIDWCEIDSLYRVVMGENDLDVTLPTNAKGAIKAIARKFPLHTFKIIKFYKLVADFCADYAQVMMADEEDITAEKFPTYCKYAFKSAQEVLDEFFPGNPRLQLCFNVYWTFMGTSPELLPFPILAGCIGIYMKFKPFYLKGGSQVISSALADVIQKNGGTINYSTEVTRLLVEDGTAVGVETAGGETFTAKRIISNICPANTYNLMDKELIPESAVQYLSAYKPGISVFGCFVGLDCPPEAVGIHESMNVFYENSDANNTFALAKQLDITDDPVVFTCYTIDDPAVSPPGTSVISMGCMKYADPWLELAPEEYADTKYRCADQMFARMEKRFPGFREHIEEVEIGSPLTFIHYIDSPSGAIYGYEQDLNSTGPFFPNESHIDNLVFSSGWVGTCGFGPNYILGHKNANKIFASLEEN